MKYRPEIDGLRALAVVPVILFHAGFELFSGGFVGVDVFFVVSGYLITTILIEDLENNRFSIISFYERRARRILPALFFVMIACVPFAWILLPDTSLRNFGSGLIGVSTFTSNVVFWMQQGYFEESAELNPILHTWSLAVEEQYYLLFPIFLMFFWRFGRARIIWTIAVTAAISLILSEWAWRFQASANFFLAPTRAWELLAGSIIAFIVKQNGVQKNNVLALVGLIAILSSIIIYDENTPFPSVYAILPVSGVALFILFAEKTTLAAKLLSTKFFVSIGLVSYSAYLWHQPIFSFVRVYTNQISIGWTTAIILISLTFLLSFCSYQIIEKPFRNRKFLNRPSIFSLSFSALIVLFALGHISKKVTIGREFELARQLSENNFVYFENLDERRFMAGRLMYPLNAVDSIVVGSSRVMQIDSGMLGENIQSFTVSGASIEDDIAFGLEALSRLNYRNIYISADPWLLNLHDGQERYQSVVELFSYWINVMSFDLAPTSFFGTDTVQLQNDASENIFSSIRNYLSLRSNTIPSDGSVEAFAKKAYDGSHIYNEIYENQIGNIDFDFAEALNYSMAEFEYDGQSIQNFETFVRYLQKNEISVTLVLVPYHPQVYQMMESQMPIFLEIESWYREFASLRDLDVIGSYDPSSMGCTSIDFYDGMHPTSSCIQSIFFTSVE